MSVSCSHSTQCAIRSRDKSLVQSIDNMALFKSSQIMLTVRSLVRARSSGIKGVTLDSRRFQNRGIAQGRGLTGKVLEVTFQLTKISKLCVNLNKNKLQQKCLNYRNQKNVVTKQGMVFWLWERERELLNPFPNFGNGNRNENFIPNFWERERERHIPFPTFGNGNETLLFPGMIGNGNRNGHKNWVKFDILS